jgi:broad specificity phosphatase PhoE
MAPIIDIVRHGQALHNALNDNFIRDPGLTEKGIAQSRELCNKYKYRYQVTYVISSPMRRAIQTTIHGFEPLFFPAADPKTGHRSEGKRIILVPELQESSARPSDTGSPAEELEYEFGRDLVDTRFLSDGWWNKDASKSFGPDPEKLAVRAQKARLYIRSLAREVAARYPNEGENTRIVVVTHSAFVKLLIVGEPVFGNAELMSCSFVDLYGDDDEALMAPVVAGLADQGQTPPAQLPVDEDNVHDHVAI